MNKQTVEVLDQRENVDAGRPGEKRQSWTGDQRVTGEGLNEHETSGGSRQGLFAVLNNFKVDT